MKKLLLLVAAIGCLAFTGCSKDDNDEPQQEPEITLDGYEEPYMKWGATKAEIKQNVPYELIKETDSGLTFSGKRMVSGYIYLTESDESSNSLNASMAIVSTAYSEELANFLFTKYIPVEADKENYRFYCVNKSKTLAVVLEIYSTQLLTVIYYPIDLSKANITTSSILGTRADVGETQSIYEKLSAKINM